MKAHKILTIGGATRDMTWQVREGVMVDNKNDLTRQKLVGFELGAKILAEECQMTFGGGAANAAVALVKLGENVTALICMGNDSQGQEILANLKKNYVKTNLLQFSADKSSGLSMVIKNKGFEQEHILFTWRGANEELKTVILTSPELSGRLAGNEYNLIYLTSLTGRSVRSNLANIFRYKNWWTKKNRSVKVAWNPGAEQIKMGLEWLGPYLRETDILLLNKDEAIELALSVSQQKKEAAEKIKNPRELLKTLADWCPGTIVVTDGARGAYVLSGLKIYFEPGQRPRIKDTTGVGDAFGATLVWALECQQFDVQKSLRLAIKNASAVLEEIGAQNGLLSRTALMKL